MGPTTSRASDERDFLEAAQQLSLPNPTNLDDVIHYAAKLRTLDCISNATIQQYYFEQPSNIQNLCLKCLEALLAVGKQEETRGALHLLAKIVPTLFVSVTNVDEIAWLVGGQNPFISQMFIALKSILFAPQIFNPPSTTNPLEWVWSELDFYLENARNDLMELFYLAYAGKYFFPAHPDIQENLIKYGSFDPDVAVRLTCSIATGLSNPRFAAKALPFLNIAALQDPSIRYALPKSCAIEKCTEYLHNQIEKINSIVGFTYSNIDHFEIDIIYTVFIILLQEPLIPIPTINLTVSFIQQLQIANEKGIPNSMHRISLIVLQTITRDQSRCKELRSRLNESLGTNFIFHSSSIVLALLEALTISLKFKANRSLALSVIHNISPFIQAVDRTASNCIANAILAMNAENDQASVSGLLISLSRYVNDKDEKETKTAQLREIFKKYLDTGKIEQSLYDKIEEAINDDGTKYNYPLILQDVNSQLKWALEVQLVLFEKRNRITYGTLRPEVDHSTHDPSSE